MSIRQDPSEELSAIYSEISSVLYNAVDLGVLFFDEWLPSSLNGEEWEIAPLMIYRSLIEKLDGVAALAEQSCVEALVIVLRTVFEGHLNLAYMLKERTRERALAYLYCLLLDYESTLGSLEIKDIPAPLSSTYSSAKAEWDRVSKVKGMPRYINWFSLFPSKPDQNIKYVKDLAQHLGYGDLYTRLYDLGSKLIHSKYDMHFADGSGERTLITSLRNPEHLQQLVAVAVYLCRKSTRLIVAKYAPERLGEFDHIFAQAVEPGLDMLKGPPLITVIESLPPGE